jgi:hypothetical protein
LAEKVYVELHDNECTDVDREDPELISSQMGWESVQIILPQNVELQKEGHGEWRRTSVYDIYITQSIRT